MKKEISFTANVVKNGWRRSIIGPVEIDNTQIEDQAADTK